MQFPKNSKKLMSLLLISALLGSAAAMAQEGRPPRFDRGNGGQQGGPRGLTPGQVADDGAQERAREEERRARAEQEQMDQQREREARDQIIRDQQARDHDRWDRMRHDDELRDAQRRLEEQQAIIDAQNEAILAQQQAQAAADEAQRLSDERKAAASRASVTTIFKKVTRKAGGEWLRINLSKPTQLSQISIKVLKAAAQFHDVIVYADNAQKFTLPDLKTTTPVKASGITKGDMRGIPNRVVAIDVRVESFSAESELSVTISAVERAIAIKKTERFAFIPAKP